MSLDENLLNKKLDSLSNSQESIQTLSLWILHNKKHFKKIIQIWCRSIRTTTKGPNHRLTIFYLANDVVQNAKKRGLSDFVNEFEKVLPNVMPLLKEDKIVSSVRRTINIWRDRGIYKGPFLERLHGILGTTSTTQTTQLPPSTSPAGEPSMTEQIVAEYKLATVTSAINEMRRLESQSGQVVSKMSVKKLSILNIDIMSHLKDKTLGDHLLKDADEIQTSLEFIVKCLESEVTQRKALIEELTKALIYYVVQNQEVDQAFKAYVKIGQNVARVLKSMTQIMDNFQPPSNAPSPTDSDDGPNLPTNSPNITSANAPNIQPVNVGHSLSLDKRLESLLQAAGVIAPGPGPSNGSSSGPSYYAPPPSSANAQPIMSVVSSRTEPGAADMDIVNSDDEDTDERVPFGQAIVPVVTPTNYYPQQIPLPQRPPPQTAIRHHPYGHPPPPLPPSHRDSVNRAYSGVPQTQPTSPRRPVNRPGPSREGWQPREDCRPIGRNDRRYKR